MPSVAALNKENRAPAGGSFALTGKTTAASKRAAASTKRPAASSSKIRKPSTTDTFADAEDEDDDELMMAGAGGEEGETVIVGETQFAQDGEGEEDDEEVEEVVPKKGARGAKKPAAGGAKGRATKKAASGTDASLTDDFDAALAIPLASMEGAGAKPSAREKKLEAQLAATKKALSESQALFAKLSELRETRAEEAEQRLREISDERIKSAGETIQSYKSESDALRTELASLQSTAFSSPRSKAALVESRRVKELEGERDEARGFSTLRTELNAEVAHSKSLQQQLKSAPSTSSSAVLPLPAAPSTSAATPTDTLKLQDEIERLTQKLNLNEDLTGFAVHSVKQEEMGATYVCLLSDCAGTTGALNFKLTFHPDGTTSYKPNLEAERDAALVQLLSPELQGYMRFGAEMSSEFFKRLFASVNKVRI
uniref:BY PROTMAP: gi/472588155/gb/EMS25627.1/ chromosome segregation protein, Pcs1 [Rhodosporidium toruloides NP11] gi/647395941/emb/CDR37862.1/ RHTO0S03e00430g1_1 [Rhodosporidium toruloides] n=1 Tax=Rhodotorula toruloides TaxID=5286 RepID=A0A0K3CHF2_RHOTO